MKITFETLDRGVLVTAEDQGTIERLAYQTATEALDAVGQALGVSVPRGTPVAPTRTPIAPTPEPRYSAEDTVELEPPLPERESAPPATRRIGLSQPSKSRPPVGRRGA